MTLASSELARGAFVTRQSMNVLLQALEHDGVVTKPATPSTGRALPVRLTRKGEAQLREATAAVRTVEKRMLADVSANEEEHVLAALRKIVTALRE